jgi:hypothetical protein
MLHELDERTADNLRVTLYWDDRNDTLTVEVEDFKDPEREHALTGIPPADAKLAFEHPFGYPPTIAVSVPAWPAPLARWTA